MGDSSIPVSGDYTAASSADDLGGLLAALNVSRAFVFSHDKGAGAAAALALKQPALVARLGLSEYGLPGFGYETQWTPQPGWTDASNWQLPFFSLTDLAEFFISGRVRETLAWYFFHFSYAGVSAVSAANLTAYTDQISKPGFLRSMLGPFSVNTVAADNQFFTARLNASKLGMPVLGLGGEAASGPYLPQVFPPLGTNVQTDVVPKAGHWIGELLGIRCIDIFKLTEGSLVQRTKIRSGWPTG